MVGTKLAKKRIPTKTGVACYFILDMSLFSDKLRPEHNFM